MGPEVQLKARAETLMEASTSKDCVSHMQEPDDKHMICASNNEYTFDMGTSSGEQNEGARKIDDLEVNIMDYMHNGENGLVQAHSQDATENSSSFGDTLSDAQNGEFGGDDEVVSKVRTDAALVVEFGGSGDLFRMRKKRLTSHWRRFIQPLLWRCKWVELQIKKFQSQAIKYDTILAENNQRKQFKLENFALDLGAKSLPFSSDSQREKVMKRKKRKRVEDLDTAAYTSHHNLFSYYVSRRSITNSASIDDDLTNLVASTDKNITENGEFGVSNELLSLDFRDDDNSLEQILWKIGVVQSQVSEMKNRLSTIMSENAGKFLSTEKLSLHVPHNGLTSSVQKSASPTSKDQVPVGSSYIASQPMPECNTGDLVMPESAASSHAEVTHLPDTIESTYQPKVDASRKSNGNGILIYNRRAKKASNDSWEVKIHPIEKLQVPKEENGSTIPPVTPQLQVPKDENCITIPPVTLLDHLRKDEQPAKKLRSISRLVPPKNKKKRARRKPGLGKWSRKLSG